MSSLQTVSSQAVSPNVSGKISCEQSRNRRPGARRGRTSFVWAPWYRKIVLARVVEALRVPTKNALLIKSHRIFLIMKSPLTFLAVRFLITGAHQAAMLLSWPSNKVTNKELAKLKAK